MQSSTHSRPSHSFALRVAALALAASAALLSSCSTEALEDRLEDRNDAYSTFQKRREMRQDARQERTDAWFDRVMH